MQAVQGHIMHGLNSIMDIELTRNALLKGCSAAVHMGHMFQVVTVTVTTGVRDSTFQGVKGG